MRADPLTMAIVWNAFVAIAEESGSVIQRTAYSQVVREAADFSAAVADRHGRLIGQGAHTVGHLGSMALALREIIRRNSDAQLEDGDVMVFNDPPLGAGHLPDIYLTAPIYWRGRLIAYAANVAHHVDVGGLTPGSHSIVGPDELVQEGLRVPPVRLYRKGDLQTDVLDIVLANTRAPESVRGDLNAQVIGLRAAEAQVRELFDRYGIEAVDLCVEDILEWSEAEVRAGISALPDGRYEAADFMDGSGPRTSPIRLHVVVEISGSDMSIDFAGTDPQVAAGMNSYFNFTYSYAYFVAKCIAGSTTPQNDGCMRPIHVTAPPGSIVNPVGGAACGGRAVMNYRIYEVVLQALAQAAPDRAVAPGSQAYNLTFGGVDPATSRAFVTYMLLLGNFGGRAQGDGPDGLTSITNTANNPVEALESAYPLRVERLEFVSDAVGAGKFRAGCPLRCDIRILADAVTFTNGTDRHIFPPPGLLGGNPGTVGRTLLNPGRRQKQLDSKGTYQLNYGDVLSLRPAGGGGLGPPEEREPAAIARDVQQGYLSARKADRDYGRAWRDFL